MRIPNAPRKKQYKSRIFNKKRLSKVTKKLNFDNGYFNQELIDHLKYRLKGIEKESDEIIEMIQKLKLEKESKNIKVINGMIVYMK